MCKGLKFLIKNKLKFCLKLNADAALESIYHYKKAHCCLPYTTRFFKYIYSDVLLMLINT